MKKPLVLFASIVLATSMFSGSNARAEDSEERDIVVVADRIKNDKSDLKVELWSTNDDHSYRVGDKVSFSFKTNKKCYVTLVSIGTSGKVTILFPNRWQKKNQVKGGKSYTVPPKDAKYTFEVHGPAGTEVLKAIATTEAHDFSEHWQEAGDFHSYDGESRDLFEKDIVPVLKKRAEKDWAEDSLRVKIR